MHPNRPYPQSEFTLSKQEATELAKELKEQLQTGSIPKADQDLIELLVAGLGDERGLLRRTFAEGLGLIGQATIPSLRKALLYNPSVTVRRAAAKTLKLVGDPSALPDLLEALINDSDPVVQGSSAGAMAIFGEKAVELLLSVLDDPKSSTLQCGLASWGLAFVGAEAPNAILKATESNNELIRAAAIAALGEQIHSFDDLAAREVLLKALDDPVANVRAEATTLIGQLNEPDWAKPYLISKLIDSSAQVRKNAALSLMKSNRPESINELREIESKETDQDVLAILRLAINQLTQSKYKEP